MGEYKSTKGQYKDAIIGDRHGCLVLVEKIGSRKIVSKNGKKYTMIIWKCRCDCGSELEYHASNILRGNTTNCGCVRQNLEEKIPSKAKGVSNSRILWHDYRRRAKKRSLDFELSFEQFLALTQAVCSYCGKGPSNSKNRRSANGEYRYNGIDRKDSSIGYLLDNCMTACWVCNCAKNDLKIEEFFGWVHDIYLHSVSPKIEI